MSNFKKVVYYKNPIDRSKKLITRVLPQEKTLYQLLKRLGIATEQLSVSINGFKPDDLPIDFKISSQDEIVIEHVLNGGGSARSNWATIVNIGSAIGAIALTAVGMPWLAAGVASIGGAIGSGLEASAQRRLARGMANKESGFPSAKNNGYGITAAQNAMTPEAPIPLIFGDINFAPPLAAPPHMSSAGGSYENIVNAYPSAIMSSVNLIDWHDVPAGALYTSPYNWPAYPVKMAPFMPAVDVLAQPLDWQANFAHIMTHGGFAPISQVMIPIFHSDPSDPYYGLFSLWGAMALYATLTPADRPATQSELLDQYGYLFGLGSRPAWYSNQNYWKTTGEHNLSRATWNVGPNAPRVVKQDVTTFLVWSSVFGGTSTNITSWVNDPSKITEVHDFFQKTLNGGLSDPNWPIKPALPARLSQLDQVYSQPRVLDLNQVFALGFGDIEVQRRTLGGVDVSNIKDAVTMDVYKEAAQFPTIIPNPDGYANFSLGVKTLDSCELRNDGSGPESPVNTVDQGVYNFVYRSTPLNCKYLYLDFEGRLYMTDPEDPTGVSYNTATFEIHLKSSSHTEYNFFRWINFRNGNADIIRKTYAFEINLDEGERLDIRIRKVDFDSTNSENPYVCEFNLNIRAECEVSTDLRAQNLNALYLRSTTNSLSNSSSYVQRVASKMRYYNYALDQWEYGITRNPAFHALFLLRGGFLNQSADGSDPNEPTIWWSNGPEKAGATELLFGSGLPDSRIDIERFVEWGRFCEINEFYFDNVFTDSMNVSEMLDVISSVGRGVIDTFRGVHSVRWQERDQDVVGIFGMSNIIAGSFRVDYNVSPIPEAMRFTFSDRENDFETSQFELNLPTDCAKEPRITEVNLTGITGRAHAERQARFIAAQTALYNKTYSWATDKEGLVYDIYDIVYGSHDSTQYSFSGRVQHFVSNDTAKTNMILSKDLIGQEMVLRMPDGEIQVFEITSVQDNRVSFTPALTDEQMPSELFDGTENELSDYENSKGLDYVLTCGFRGKRMRIVGIEQTDENIYQITAIDDDIKVWEFEEGEIDEIDNAQSMNDSTILYKVKSFKYYTIDESLHLIWTGVNQIKIYDLDAEQYITDLNGKDVFSGNVAKLDLPLGKYNFELQPQVLGLSGVQNKVVSVWHK